jgi:hypothetical protein
MASRWCAARDRRPSILLAGTPAQVRKINGVYRYKDTCPGNTRGDFRCLATRRRTGASVRGWLSAGPPFRSCASPGSGPSGWVTRVACSRHPRGGAVPLPRAARARRTPQPGASWHIRLANGRSSAEVAAITVQAVEAHRPRPACKSIGAQFRCPASRHSSVFR